MRTVGTAVCCHAVVGLLTTAGCLKPNCPNSALGTFDPARGYRFETLDPGDGNTDDLFVCVSFSGGGTRAAAFAYGVLMGLDEITLPTARADGSPATMLDEVDMISSVSGGSFTAMGYGLWGKGLFDGRFRRRFLERNVQLFLLLNLLRPKNLLLIPSFLLDTSDIAATFYNQRVFDEHTYQDLLDRNRRPLIVVNATDLTRRHRFAFTQDDFDLLGSDLASLPVGWAVAASSAFPILLSPLRLQYFHGQPLNDAVKAVLAAPPRSRSPRHELWARSLLVNDAGRTAEAEIDGRRHRYMYLLDGGVADNLGVTAFIESFRTGAVRRLIEQERLKRLAIVIVDAATDPPEELEGKAASPGILTVGERSASTAIHAHSAVLTATIRFALLEAQPLAREVQRQCREMIGERCPDLSLDDWRPVREIEGYVVDVDFYKVSDGALREDLLEMITSFFLPVHDVQKLIDAGRRVVREHPEIRRLAEDLEADAKKAADDAS
jgi:predicted acylesterase/phospholipase RssA